MNASSRALSACLIAALIALFILAVSASASRKDVPDAKAPVAHPKGQSPLPPPRFQRCGLACTKGYHVVSQSCDAVTCEGKCPNQVWCERNEGKVFLQCGLTCPVGYHAKDQTCNAVACPASCPNQAWCEKDE